MRGTTTGSGRRRRGHSGTPVRTTVARDLCMFMLMMGVAAIAAWPLYQDAWLAVTVLAGVLSAVAAALLMHWLRLPWMLQLPLGLAWALVVGVPAAIPDESLAGVLPTLDGLGSLISACLTSWVDIISVDPPLGHYASVLVPVFIVAHGGGWVATVGSLRGRHWPGAVAALAMLILGIVFGSQNGFHAAALGAVLLVLALVWTQLLRRHGQGTSVEHTRALRSGGVRRGVVAVGFVAICAVAGAGITALLPPDHRTVARSGFVAQYAPTQQVSPLQEYRSWVTGQRKDKVVASMDTTSNESMLRVAVLDDYDGVAFNVASSAGHHGFTRLPSKVSRPAGPREDVQVTVKRPLGEWVPLAGALESIDLAGTQRDRFYYDRDLDAALIRGGVKKGSSYRLHSVPDAPAARGGLERLRPGKVTQPTLPVLPESLVAAADQAAGEQKTPGARLQAVLDMLHAGYVSHADDGEIFSRSGHSAQRLDALVDEEPMVGDAEQYAAAFAVLARQQGFASRVVLGFVDANHDGDLTGSELSAWVEVDDATRGWVAVDPNPEPRPVKKPERSKRDTVSLPRTVLPPDTPVRRDMVPPSTDNNPPQPPAKPDAMHHLVQVVWWWVWRVGLALLVLTLPAWGALLLKWARRLRRRRADLAAMRVSGAWDEVRDHVVDAALPAPAAATRLELADSLSDDDVPGSRGEGLVLQAKELARASDGLTFGASGATSAQVQEVWDQCGELNKRIVTAPETRRKRWARRLSWRSLRRRQPRDPK